MSIPLTAIPPIVVTEILGEAALVVYDQDNSGASYRHLEILQANLIAQGFQATMGLTQENQLYLEVSGAVEETLDAINHHFSRSSSYRSPYRLGR